MPFGEASVALRIGFLDGVGKLRLGAHLVEELNEPLGVGPPRSRLRFVSMGGTRRHRPPVGLARYKGEPGGAEHAESPRPAPYPRGGGGGPLSCSPLAGSADCGTPPLAR